MHAKLDHFIQYIFGLLIIDHIPAEVYTGIHIYGTILKENKHVCA